VLTVDNVGTKKFSIGRFKDGRPYPWASDVSSLILYPEAENQTIYTRSVRSADVGTYTCRLQNDTYRIEHNVTINVQENVPDAPLPTVRPESQYVHVGEFVRMYCEAFVGKVMLPDARTSIAWYQAFENDIEQKVEGQPEAIAREDDQVIGAYLIIPNVETHNYGRYLCRIEIGNSAHRLDMYAWILGDPTRQEEDPMVLSLYLALTLASGIMFAVLIIKFLYDRQMMKKKQCEGMELDTVLALNPFVKAHI
ncbi:Fibroblast growth factor receptor 3, partial [Pseudolycoriella hygida]